MTEKKPDTGNGLPQTLLEQELGPDEMMVITSTTAAQEGNNNSMKVTHRHSKQKAPDFFVFVKLQQIWKMHFRLHHSRTVSCLEIKICWQHKEHIGV
ncbi:hypothetical protein Y1Q_0010729 [Alligator mississippiensis]|uniref:Uncharacterized protein n=1 Tax=Alligator mississippiensis TaxID=8496 RepID=A0A151M6M1_ALLMI|nr:hypothetical protein Y1Q_0010729 [Alligator mississippiensis]